MAGQNTILYTIEVDDKGSPKLRQFTGEFNAGLKQSTSQIEMLKRGLAGLGIGLAAREVYRFGEASVKSYAAFSKGLSETATLSGEVARHMDRYAAGVLRISNETGQATQSLNKALYDAISAGVPAGEALEFVASSAKLAVGGVSDVAATTNLLTGTLNAYHLPASRAAEISDQLFTTVRLGKTTISELSAYLGQVSPSAAAAGLGTQELMASMSALTLVLGNTAKASTALDGLLRALARPSDELREVIAAAGYESGIAMIKAEGFAGALRLLDTASGGSLDKMLQLVPEIEGARAANILAAQGAEVFTAHLREQDRAAGANAGALAVMSRDAGFNLERLNTRWENLFTVVGGKIAPELEQLGETLYTRTIPAFERLMGLLASPTTRKFAGEAAQVADNINTITAAVDMLLARREQMNFFEGWLGESAGKLVQFQGLLKPLNDMNSSGLLKALVLRDPAALFDHAIKNLATLDIKTKSLTASEQRELEVIIAIQQARAKAGAHKRQPKPPSPPRAAPGDGAGDLETEAERKRRIKERQRLEKDFLDWYHQVTLSDVEYAIQRETEKFEMFKEKLGEREDLYKTSSAAVEKIHAEAAEKEADEQERARKKAEAEREREWDAHVESVKKGQRGVTAAITAGWEDAARAAKTSHELIFDAANTTYNDLHDALAGFIESGEADFESFGQTIINIWKRMAAEIAANEIMGVIGLSPTGGAPGLITGASQALGLGDIAGALGFGETAAAAAAMNAGAPEAALAAASMAEGAGAGIAGGAASGGALASIGAFAVANPLLAAGLLVGAGLLGSQLFGGGGEDRADQTVYGVKDAHKDPLGSIGAAAGKFTEHRKAGDDYGAGFALRQISDITDRFVDLSPLTHELGEKFADLAHRAHQVGETVQETGINSEESGAALEGLSHDAADLALNLLLSGNAASGHASAALAMAAATNTTAASAREELAAMSALAGQLYQTSAATWALSAAAEGARAAQEMMNLAGGLTYEQYQQIQGAETRLGQIEAERAAIMAELNDETQESPERFAELQARLVSLGAESGAILEGLTNLSGAAKDVGDGADESAAAIGGVETSSRAAKGEVDALGRNIKTAGDNSRISADYVRGLRDQIDLLHDKTITITTQYQEIKLHEGMFLAPFETRATIRKDEMVVPPERRMEFARRVLANEGGAAAGPVTVEVGSIVVNAAPGMDERALAGAVADQILALSERGRRVVHERGIARGRA